MAFLEWRPLIAQAVRCAAADGLGGAPFIPERFRIVRVCLRPT